MEIFMLFSRLVLLFLLPNAEAHFHTLKFTSLSPNPVCNRSTGTRNGASTTLEITHRYGPCSTLGQHKPSLDKILVYDQARVRSIQLTRRIPIGDEKVEIPARLGSALGVLNYVVTVGLGTPEKTLSLQFDTGSSLTWTQCQPCSVSCHNQKDSIFDPSASSTYSDVTCSTPQCKQVGRLATCDATTSTCRYKIMYADMSGTRGFVSQDKLTLTPTDVVQNFLFGCSQEIVGNSQLFGQSAGTLGLGKDPASLISQTAEKYGRYFSYCLPPTPSTTGHLTLGAGAGSVQFTPFASSSDTSHYYIDITGITVGRNQIPVDPSVFKTAGCVIDSGTVISRLPPTAYRAMTAAFRERMAAYRSVSGVGILDTCYDFSESENSNILIPKISFMFAGNVKIDLAPEGILLVYQGGIACLAFAANEDDGQLAIFGNTQQKTMEVVYDVAGGKLGFRPGAC